LRDVPLDFHIRLALAYYPSRDIDKRLTRLTLQPCLQLHRITIGDPPECPAHIEGYERQDSN